MIVCLSASFGLSIHISLSASSGFSIHIALSASLNLSLSASRRTVWIARKAITSARSLDVDPIILLTTVVVDMPWRRRRCLSVLTSAATQIYLPAIDTLVTGMTMSSIAPILNTPTIFPLLLKLELCLRVVVVVPQFVQGQERPCATHPCAAVNQDGSRFVRLELESSNSRVL